MKLNCFYYLIMGISIIILGILLDDPELFYAVITFSIIMGFGLVLECLERRKK